MKNTVDLEMDSILKAAESATSVDDIEKLSRRFTALWMGQMTPKQVRRAELVSCAVTMRAKLMEMDLIAKKYRNLLKEVK